MRPAPTETLEMPPKLAQHTGYPTHLGFGLSVLACRDAKAGVEHIGVPAI